MTETAGKWLRVSGRKQDEANQVPDIDAWITSHGYETARTYSVHGGSAHKGNRKFDEAWAAVLEDIRAGRITVLIVWALDRLDRKLAALQMLEQVLDAGGRVEFVTQPHLNDLTSMGNRIALYVQMEIAHAESEAKAQRTRITHERIRGNGGYLGRPAFGLERVGDEYSPKLAPTDEGREVVPEAFRKVAAGESLGQVGSWLAQVTGRPWWPGAVAGLVRNTAYRGSVQDAAGKILHKCEALVGSQLWQDANESLDSRPKRGSKLAEDSALSGALACVVCSGPMYRIRTGDGTWRYRCVGKGPRRGSACRNMIRCDATDALMDEVMAQLRRPVVTWEKVPGSNHDEEKADVALALADLPRQGLDRRAEQAERERLWAEQDRLEALPDVPDRMVPAVTDRTYAGEWEDLDPAGRRAWLKRAGFALSAGRPELVADADAGPDEHPGEALSRVDVYANEAAGLVFTWTGDTDPGLARSL